MNCTTTVYVTTSDGALGEIYIDGDVTVLSCDWANLEPVRSGNELAEEIGLRDGLPDGLIQAVVDDIQGAGHEVTARPTPGPDNPWAYVTFVDQTFASEGVQASGTSVVYHDWSLWFADLGIGVKRDDEWIDALETEARQLGPKGQEAALAIIEAFRSACKEQG